MKIVLLLLLLVLLYLVVRFVLLAGRVKREAEQAFNGYWQARNRGETPGFRASRRAGAPLEKDISDRARVIEERSGD